MHFLRASFVFHVLLTVFLKRLSFPTDKLCRTWLPGLLSSRKDHTPQCIASFLGAETLVSALLLSTVWVWKVVLGQAC